VGTQRYRAIVDRYQSRPNQCTIFLSEGQEGELTSTWITAHEGSYVSLSLMR
jgi:hypothetical protein